MKLASIVSETEFNRLGEIAPVTTSASTAPLTPGATTLTPTQQVGQDPAAQAKMQAQQALDRQNRKKQIQDEISQTQKHLQQLQKDLAALR